jgi:hypothetical protein
MHIPYVPTRIRNVELMKWGNSNCIKVHFVKTIKLIENKLMIILSKLHMAFLASNTRRSVGGLEVLEDEIMD